MPRNVFKFPEEKGLKSRENIEAYKKFVEDYISTRRCSGQFVNCKIYGNISDGEVYTTWLFDSLPNKKELKIAGVIEEIAPTKQGFPCCIISRKLDANERKVIQKGVKDFEICYEFKMVMYSKIKDLDEYTAQGWQVRKWFESLNIYTIADLDMDNRNPEW